MSNDTKHMCAACGAVPVDGPRKACPACTMAALGAYGWTNGTPMGDGLIRRGRPDERARKELDRRTGGDD